MNLLQSHSLDFQSRKFPCSCECDTGDIGNMWSVLNPPLPCTSVPLCVQVSEMQLKYDSVRNILIKQGRLDYYKEEKQIKDFLCLCCQWKSCISCFGGKIHRTVGVSMWLLSQWGNMDQVVQWAKAGVVKSSSEKNSTSLGGTKYPCVGYGHKLSLLFRCELLCEAPLCFYANVKDDSKSPSSIKAAR